MKKPVTNLLTALLIAFVPAIAGCQKAPINGNLDGQWQITETNPYPSDIIISGKLYYNFSLHICMLTYYDGWFMSGNMVYDGKRLSLEFPYADTEEEMAILKQYGIFSNPVTFEVNFPNKRTLILSNEESTVWLTKF